MNKVLKAVMEELDLELGQAFKVNGFGSSFKICDNKLYFLDDEQLGYVWCESGEYGYGVILKRIMNGTLEIEKVDEIEISREDEEKLEALLDAGFEYIAEDRNGYQYAYMGKPKKILSDWDFDGKCLSLSGLDIEFDFISWSDEEPLEIKKYI